MGRYRKKPYKRKQIDPWHEWDLKEEIKYEIDAYQDISLQQEPFEEEESMQSLIDEPDIVKELREEERLGKLYLFHSVDENIDEYVMPEFREYDLLISDEIKNKKTVKSYEEAYELAKKVFHNI